jgi:hypothetical protein
MTHNNIQHLYSFAQDGSALPEIKGGIDWVINSTPAQIIKFNFLLTQVWAIERADVTLVRLLQPLILLVKLIFLLI